MKERLLYSRWEVEGYNQERLLNTLKNRGVGVYRVRKIQKNRMRLTVSAASESKFFAICTQSCYNVRRKGRSGALKPFLRLAARPGLAAGAAVFLALALAADGRMLAIEVTGSGAVCRAEIERALEEQGVRKFGAFRDWDMKGLERALFASERFSFVSVEKSGYRLRVRAELSGEPPAVLGKGDTELVSDRAGRVIAIKVLRGAAVVSVGDAVAEGDLLVTGKVTEGEEETEGTVLAVVRLECEHVCRFPAGEGERDADAAAIFARESLPEGCVAVGSKTEKDEATGEYVVTVYYETELYGG